MSNSADQLSEIRSGLREALSGGGGVCVTFEVEGMEDKWVQYVGGTINAAYGSTAAPALSTIPVALQEAVGRVWLADWEPAKFFTLGIEKAEAGPLAKLIDWIFTEIQGCAAGDYHLSVDVDDV